jgi:RNA polymerase sigma-70 factor (ECF subfamily)
VLKSLLKSNNSSQSFTEEDLIERISEGDDSALLKLYDSYSRIVFSLILKIIKNKEEAEDILQTVFMKIWNKAEKFNKNKGGVYSWIITIARNLAIDRLRSKQFKSARNHVYEINDVKNKISDNLSGLDSAIIKERAELINSALERIPTEQKMLIELAYFQGFTQSELSETLNIPLGTVKTRMRQALDKLEKMLTPVVSKNLI